jgi:hypothetical protein
MEAGIASLYDSHNIQRWTEEAQQTDQELPPAPMFTMPAAAVSAADPRQQNQGAVLCHRSIAFAQPKQSLGF